MRDGIYNRKDLMREGFPIAWSGTVPADVRAERDGKRNALIRESLEAIDSDPDGVAVEIKDGEVIAILCGGGES